MVVQYCKTYTGRADGETGFTDRTNRTIRENGLRIVNKVFQSVKESVCD